MKDKDFREQKVAMTFQKLREKFKLKELQGWLQRTCVTYLHREDGCYDAT